MTGRPAATLLHLGPGLANGLANLHNARRARVPLINWIGDQTTSHLAFDAPLTSEIALLTDWCGWTRAVKSAGEIAEVTVGGADPVMFDLEGLPAALAELAPEKRERFLGGTIEGVFARMGEGLG